MRRHHVIAVVAVLVIGLGAKQYMFPPEQADVTVSTTASINFLQMYSDIDMRSIPQQKINDKTFIFTDEEYSRRSKSLGITIPLPVLGRTDDVVE